MGGDGKGWGKRAGGEESGWGGRADGEQVGKEKEWGRRAGEDKEQVEMGNVPDCLQAWPYRETFREAP